MVQDRQESTTKEGEFERRLDAILKRYKITNLSFAAEIANLHKKYWSSLFKYQLYYHMQILGYHSANNILNITPILSLLI